LRRAPTSGGDAQQCRENDAPEHDASMPSIDLRFVSASTHSGMRE
jgi:hypothetical protein